MLGRQRQRCYKKGPGFDTLLLGQRVAEALTKDTAYSKHCFDHFGHLTYEREGKTEKGMH